MVSPINVSVTKEQIITVNMLPHTFKSIFLRNMPTMAAGNIDAEERKIYLATLIFIGIYLHSNITLITEIKV